MGNNNIGADPAQGNFVGRAAVPSLTVFAGDDTVASHATTDLSDTAVAALMTACQQCNGPLIFQIDGLSQWPQGSFWPVLGIIKDLGTWATVRINRRNFSDPLQAVLAAMAPAKNLAQHERTIQMAIEAAALFHGAMPKPAAGAIDARIAEVGGTKLGTRELVARIKGLAGSEGDGETDDSARGFDGLKVAEKYLAYLNETCAQNGHATPALDPFTVEIPAGGDGAAGDGAAAQSAGEIHRDDPPLRYYRQDFYCWNGRCWDRLSDDLVRAKVTLFLQQRAFEHITPSVVETVLTNLKALALLDGWKQSLPFYVASTAPLQTRRRNLLVLNNGVLDLDHFSATGDYRLLPHDRRHFNTVVLDYDFNAQARCPRWRQFIQRVLPRTGAGDKRQAILQRMMGYTLTPNCKFEVMLVMVGDGKNGKSTALFVWDHMLGSDNVTNVPLDRLSQDALFVTLDGKLANFSRDLNHLSPTDEARVKQIVSGEPITTNRKFKDAVPITTCAKLVVAANQLPDVSDPTQGMWRRLILMPFDVVIPARERNENLKYELAADELPGILIWTLRGLRRLLRHRRFPDCARCRRLAQHHRNESNSVREFFCECCTMANDSQVYSDRLYELYRFFTEARGRKPVQSNVFGRRLKAMHVRKRRGSSGIPSDRPWVYQPIGLTFDGLEWLRRCNVEMEPAWTDLYYMVPAAQRASRSR